MTPVILGGIALAVGAYALSQQQQQEAAAPPHADDPNLPPSVNASQVDARNPTHGGIPAGGRRGDDPELPPSTMSPSGDVGDLGGDQLAPGTCATCGGGKRPSSVQTTAAATPGAVTAQPQTHGGANAMRTLTPVERNRILATYGPSMGLVF